MIDTISAAMVFAPIFAVAQGIVPQRLVNCRQKLILTREALVSRLH
jgi:hypothetical protein